MKIATLIARILLGLLFLVFGLNGFLHFIPMTPPPGLAGQYMGALFLALWAILFYSVRRAFASLLVQRVEV
jgi:putative oxidoreductase